MEGSSLTPTRVRTNPSRRDGRGNAPRSLTTRTRQVEHRARPPQTLACGTLNRRLVSRILRPLGTRTRRLGYDTVIDPRRLSSTARTPRAANTSTIADRYRIG